jgi:2-polyprenyl-6-methoxyphenol hydroxylase-like FAD-dependent oxidoreductase
MLNIYHPRMQDAMIARAVAAGAIVRRGATVLGVDAGPGREPVVTYEVDGEQRTASARIVVGADGRSSQVRSWCGFDVVRTPELLRVSGMLIEGSSVPEHGAYFAVGPGVASFWAPQGGGRARAYFVYPGATGDRQLTGKQRVSEFLRAVASAGVPPEWLDGVQSIGPLAEFEGADRHVPTPAKNGVVLIGDAAGASDPSWGSGLSLTLIDVEHLTAALRSCDDWNVAIARYAGEHDQYYDALHRIHSWMTELAWTPGPEADARRQRVMPKWIAQVEGFPDLVGLGPFGPSDERARRMTLGLD